MNTFQVQRQTSLLCTDKKDKPQRMTPSVFTQEMLQSSEERLENIREVHPPHILEHFSASSKTHPKMSFQVFPSELVFQNFTPFQTYTLPLILLNKGTVPQSVMLEKLNSKVFHVVGPENGSGKVASGLAATFTVSFTPQENKDYISNLQFETQRERFVVPVRAIGPRAILDFRDEVLLPVCHVKASTEKTHNVYNIGNSRAMFELRTQSPFSVTPSCGTLDVGESMQVTVFFQPMTVGSHQEDLVLHYHTGEDVYISLSGTCVELDLRFESDIVELKKTYIGLANTHTACLVNKNHFPLRFRWTVWPSQQDEDLGSFRESSILQRGDKEEEAPLPYESNPTAIHHLPLLSRSLQDHFPILSLGCMSLEPMEGEIYPKTTAQFHIVFKPKEARLYQHTIYCDITGHESRLPLIISGEGLGPKLQLNYNLMDIKNVFIGDKNRYEVQISNKGLIDAPFRFSSSDTTFGHYFSIRPTEGVVPPEAHQIVEVTFKSHTLGPFSEDLLLTVTGQPQPLTLTFRGCVICPTFNFDVWDLEFGDVAFGFPSTLTCTLFNTSFVPINFVLRVLGDGLGSPSVSGFRQVSDLSLKSWQGHTAQGVHERPVEFTVSPAAGSVSAMSDITIKVTLCSNTVKTYWVAMVVDVEGVGEHIRTLPINARCVVPEITVEPLVLDFKRCYLDRSYRQKVKLTNSSGLYACYGVLEQESEESSQLIFNFPEPRGVLPPHSSLELPVLLVAKAVGQLSHALHISVFGSLQQPLEVILSCTGQGPVVHIPIPQLRFGKIPVLSDIDRSLQLFNQSPIPAHFTTSMDNKNSFWRVEPSHGEVPPEGQLKLKIVAHLRDTLSFHDKLRISIQDSQTHIISVSATGGGTTIISDRPFGPSLDLGTHFSRSSSQFHFKLTNHGQRVHRMYWKIDGILSSPQKHKRGSTSNTGFLPPISPPRQKDTITRGSFLSAGQNSELSLSPCRMELFPGDSCDMVLTTSSDVPKVIHKRLVCQGFIGHESRQETIMTVDVTCRFVAPVLSLSTKKLNFYIKKVKGQSVLPVYEKLVLSNVSPLSLSMMLSLDAPFFLCDARGNHSATTKSIFLHNSSQTELWVCFNPAVYKDQATHIVDELLKISYLEHPHHYMVELHAEVHYPNLHFSSTVVDFGCVHKSTEANTEMTITNCSQLPVSYRWAFLDHRQHIKDTETVGKKMKQEDPESSSTTVSTFLSLPPILRHGEDENQKEVFDILPMSGHLQPGEQQLVTFSFFNDESISREGVALCHVEDGPTYEVKLRGEASVISYSVEPTWLDFGLQLFYSVGELYMTVRNTGKLGFNFSIEFPHCEKEEEHNVDELPPDAQHQNEDLEVRPGRPAVLPAVGFIKAGSKQDLRVLYLPGLPEVFEKHFKVLVALLAPKKVTVTGVGVFPRVLLDLPRNLSDQCYSDVVEQAKASVLANGVRIRGQASCTLTDEELLQMEVERLLLSGVLMEITHSQKSFQLQPSKFKLPEYVLDFGFAIPGKAVNQSVNIINTGSVPVSFYMNGKLLIGTGFTAASERVKNLPCGQTHSFLLTFDPERANLEMGETSVVLPVQVSGGPQVMVRLRAFVIVPRITVFEDTLQFDSVQRGMCQMRTLQLLNLEPIPCCWSITEEAKPFKKVDRFVPLHVRKKILQEQRPPLTVLEMSPCDGVLSPGGKVLVYVTFCPAEGGSYRRRLKVHVKDSSQQLMITAVGQCEEPQLDLCQAVLELGPCLPFYTEAESEIMIRNPCSFPIEFYSLEFDSEYLKEEKILRLMPGYDENNVLLLPPRVPGEGLPTELLDHYKDLSSQLEDDGPNVVDDQTKNDDIRKENVKSKQNNTRMSASDVKPAKTIISELNREANRGRLGELEMTPVSRALARHMGFDLSPEGLMACSRSGIAIIVYGAPLTDSSSVAADLAGYYEAACLSVDAVVTDVIQNGTSPVSLSARQLYHTAAECAQLKAGASPAPVDIQAEQRESSCRPRRSIHQDTDDKRFYECHGEVQLSSLLPGHLLVDILMERFQLNDCDQGVVVDGLKSQYTETSSNTLQVVLKALKNRKYIYVVNVNDTYAARKAREKEQKEAEDALQHERPGGEEQQVWELKEDEREHGTQRKLRELEAKPQEERRQQDGKSRQNEELKKKKNGRRMNSTETSAGAKEQLNLNESAQHQSKKERPLQLLEEEKLSGNAFLKPRVQSEKKMNIMDELQSQFIEYEESQVMVMHFLQHWDRIQGLLLAPLPGAEIPPDSNVATAEHQHKADNKPGDTGSSLQNIPLIVMNVTETGGNFTELLSNGTLPLLDEILDHLGLGPSSPPIPPPATFSAVVFPKQRDRTMVKETCFIFLEPSGQKTDAKQTMKEALSKSNEGAIKENVKDKEKKVKENKMKAQKSKSKGSCILSQVSFPVELTDHDHHQQRLEMKRSQSRTTFRWIVPPNGQVPLKVWFYSETTGEYEQIFNFEIAGTRKPFQLTCRGRCTYPFICSKHTTLFTHCEKVPQGKDELQRAYIIKDGYFEFGPLLCAKPRDRYKECGFPENSVRVVIHNISSLDAEVMFSFQHDLQAATYLLDPPMMILPPGQKQELTIWAYPTKEGQIKDSVVCLVKDNPEPVIINVSCWGVHPKLELERKSLNFGKLLLHRRDSRSTELFNKTSLPVSWRLQGVEEFCEELVVPQVQGIIPPNSSFTLSVEFTPKRPLVFEKVLYLEVSDAEKILGTVQSLTIRVTAEAWDLKLEITPDIQLDFGTVRVFQETKQSVRLVNKGKCDLSVKFMVMQSNPALPKPESIFTITPQKSFQLPIKKPTTVSITCTPDREVSIKSQPILVCQVMEFKFGEKGQTLTFVDFHVSLQAVFSRYQITPAQEADFGPLVCGTKKSQSFNIENKGQLQFQFTISCNGSHPGENSSAKSTCTGPKRKETPVQQKLLTLGEFSVCPCSGSVQPGSSQQVIVDFVADQPGTWNQILVIDISGRNPSDHPDGIPYRLMAEACKPAIDLDTTFIFEEHFLCHSRSQLSSDQFREAEGIYVVDENKFVFNKIQVGRTAQARFRMTNTNNVSCRLKLAIRSVRPQASQNMDIFGLPVTVLKVPKQSHALAFVTFTPKAAQHYSAVFQAMVEGSGSTTSENKRLEFGLEGEGNLPTIRVLRPVLRTSSGAPKMHFGHVWVGRRRTLPLVLLNDGNVTAQVHIYMMDKFGVFTIEDSSGNTSVHSTQPEDSDVRSEHRAILTLNAKEQTSFEVSFCSDKPMCVRASLLLQVKDNKHSNTTVQVTGEAYQEIISLNNILRSPQQTDQEEEPEGNYKVLHFGDCYINMVHQKRFTMTNHSSSQVARFEWPLGEPLINISPQVGHIHAGCSKEVIVSFRSSQPVTLINQPMRCKICLVELQQPTQQMADWDDQQRIVLYESTSSLSASESSEQPVVTKVTKTVPQPACSVVEGSEGELNLCISAVCDFMKFSCNTDSIHFKDTGIFQTRIHQLQMMNVGDVKVEFSWNVYMDPGTNFINRDQKGETSTSRSSSRSSVSLSGRPSSALGSIMSLLMRNPEELPFSVEPAFGTIDPGATQSFHIRFSPVEVAQFQGKLLCSIPNLQDGDQAPCIPVLGRSLLPHCHFDFEDSDYISNNRRRPEFRRPVDPNSRVLEFEAVGLFQTTTRCFNVVNPTSKAYSFRWRCEDTDATRFRCLTSSGSIQPGTSLEMRFKYSANQKDTVESFWSFVVETLSLSVPFLLVGTAREPHVYLSRAHVDFGELTVGCKFQQTVDLVNEEKEPAHFSVLQSSLSSEDQQSCVILKPMDGEVASESRLPLLVFFNPTSKRPVNFKLVLKVKRKSEPLTLTVKANCFSENTSVLVETQDGALREVTPTQRDTLDFGKVGISEQSSFNILVFNPSKFTLEVTFELSGPRDQLRHLKAKHSTATIKAGVQLHTSLSFSPQSVCRLQGVTLTMKVKLGPTFTFVIKGSAEKARQH